MTTDERFPQIICSMCVKDLTTGYVFKLKCEQSDIFLKKEIWNQIPELKKKKDAACSTDDLLVADALIEEVSEVVNADGSCEKTTVKRKPTCEGAPRKKVKNDDTTGSVEVSEKVATTSTLGNFGNRIHLGVGLKVEGRHIGLADDLEYEIINEPLSDADLYSMGLDVFTKPTTGSFTPDYLHNNAYSYPQIMKCGNMKLEAFEPGTYEISEAEIELIKQETAVQNADDEHLAISSDSSYVYEEDEDGEGKPIKVENTKKTIQNKDAKKVKRRKRGSKKVISSNLTCCSCPESFTRLLDVKIHFVEMHTHGNFCMVCQKEYSQIKHHANVHFKLDNFFKCDKCPEAFNTEYMFAKHYTRFHPSYLCQMCDVDLENEEAYKEHIAGHDKRPAKAIEDFNMKKHCEYCNKLFDGLTKLKSHFEEEHLDGNMCRICEKDIPKSNLFKHIQDHIGVRKIRCDICKKYMSSGAELALKVHHTMFHGGCEVCQFCLVELENKEEFDKHLLEHELNGTLNRYRCKVCLKDTVSVSTLLAHSTVHERLIQCQSCLHRFTTQSQYNRHLALDHKVKCSPTCRLCRLVEDNTES